MLGYSLWLGNRYYPIPYNWKRIGGYVALGLGLFVLFSCADKFLVSTDTLSGGEMMVARIALGTLAVIGYMAYVVYRNRDLLKRTK